MIDEDQIQMPISNCAPTIPVNTRIAPAPSGMFHLGTARTAYHNWLAARSTDGKFLLRIDDTNEELSDDKFVNVIHDAMNWLGLNHDLCFKQSSRMDRYHEVAAELREKGHAIKVEGGAIALHKPTTPKKFYDTVVGWVNVSPEDQEKCEGLILIRSDGKPTYHFATVIDDHDYDINYVIRGQDHVSNTARQVAIYRTIGWLAPIYAHVGLIHKDGKKMSKRDGAASLLDYREKGYDPDALLNYMLRLGWGPYVDDKNANYIVRDRAVNMFFKEGKLRPASSNFDQMKLDWLDRKHKAAKKKPSVT